MTKDLKNEIYQDNGAQILIVEDSQTQALRLQYILEKYNYHVMVAFNGMEALSFIKDHKPEIVISDIMMPKMDGYELCKRIKANGNFKDIPVILLTTLSNPEDIIRGLESGADNFITKPYEEKFLLSRIRYILANQELRRSSQAEIGIEIYFAGKKRFISSDRIQIIDLLISSFETAVHKNLQLEQRNIELKKAFETIRTLESNYRALLDSKGDAMIVVDKDGIIRYANPAAQDLFKHGANKLIGETFGFPISLGEIKEVEVTNTGEEKIIAEMRIVDIEWESKVALLATLHDVTDRKRALEELEKTRQQQLQMKDQFLSHVSHELRTPLTAIHQFVSILLDGIAGNLNDEQYKYLEIMMKNVNQLSGMIEDLLEVTRAETGKLTIEPQITHLHELVEETLDTLRNTAYEKGVILSSDVPNDLPPAYADPQRVRQVLINLIDNGIKFTPENGMVTVRADVYKEDPDFLRMSVADNGRGISPGECEKVFEHLYQAKSTIEATRKGIGLGLYICRDLVHRQGGRIWVESQLGQGSTFIFTLPIFSLESLLAPVLISENLQEGAIALITVEAFLAEKSLIGKAAETALMEVWKVLNTCKLPDKDVLLPRLGRIKFGEIFFMVACTNEKGVEVLTRRIRDQLTKIKTIQDILKIEVSSTMIDISSLNEVEDFKQFLTNVSETIEDMLKTILNKTIMPTRWHKGE